jgi:hypothetical protein
MHMMASPPTRINKEEVLREGVAARLTAVYAARVDKTRFLEADHNLLYARVRLAGEKLVPCGSLSFNALF